MTLGDTTGLLYINTVRFIRLSIINLFSRLLFKNKTNYTKILINRDGAFGDSVVALPALSLIRQKYPKAQIDLLSINDGNISFKEVGLNEGLINNIISTKKNHRKKTLMRLKKENYDLFIQIPQNIGIYKSIRNMLLVRFYLKTRSAFGWDCGRIKSFMRLQKEHFVIPTETNRFIKVLQKHDIAGEPSYPISPQEPHDPTVRQFLSSQQPIVFLIGGKLQPKKWPINNWVTLANLIGGQNKILILGGTDEKIEADEIVSQTKNAINWCGKLSIPELHYVLTKSSIAISLDTGAMHLCDAAKLKTIALFSTRDLSNKWWPNNKSSIVIEKVLPCSFCLKTVCSDNICMTNIKPNEVYAAFKKLI
ncbi:MAG: ADP-heptose:LPS heptosyltransferase [Gammaproteobacteria bacterium]|jgi:ADP-heptose:LPS heptosyltransferase